MNKSALKEKAIGLRKLGFSYGQIYKQLGISKSTCSLWLKTTKIGKHALSRLALREFRGREKALQTIRNKAERSNQEILEKAQSGIRSIRLNRNLCKLLCAFLYWGEGEKNGKAVTFTNSDPIMVKTYISLLTEAFGTNVLELKVFLHLHPYHNKENQIRFWSKTTGIPKSNFSIYNKANSGKIIRKDYPGCISVRLYNVKILRELQLFYRLFAKNMGAW